MSVLMNNALDFLEENANVINDYKELNNLARLTDHLRVVYAYSEDQERFDRIIKIVEGKLTDTSMEIELKDNNKTFGIMAEFLQSTVSSDLPAILTGYGANEIWSRLSMLIPAKSKMLIQREKEEDLSFDMTGCYILVETSNETKSSIENIALRTPSTLFSFFYRRDGKVVRVATIPEEVKSSIKTREAFKLFA